MITNGKFLCIAGIAAALMATPGQAQGLPNWKIARICAADSANASCRLFEAVARQELAGSWDFLPENWRRSCLTTFTPPLEPSWRILGDCIEDQAHAASASRIAADAASARQGVAAMDARKLATKQRVAADATVKMAAQKAKRQAAADDARRRAADQAESDRQARAATAAQEREAAARRRDALSARIGRALAAETAARSTAMAAAEAKREADAAADARRNAAAMAESGRMKRAAAAAADWQAAADRRAQLTARIARQLTTEDSARNAAMAAAEAKRKADAMAAAQRKADVEAATRRAAAAQAETNRMQRASAAAAQWQAAAERRDQLSTRIARQLAAENASRTAALAAARTRAATKACQDNFAQIAASGVIQFEVGGATLSQDAFATLDALAEVARSCPGAKIAIEGHTDSQGLENSNQILSQQRADAVLAYLNQAGIAGGRLSARGFGEISPIASNANRAGRAKNRRIEFKVN